MEGELWDRFVEPSPAFSPAPLWWWSGDTVTAERLRWQLERLAAGGVFNVVVMNVAPTSPLYGKDADDPPFMSDAWWDLFEGACRVAQELGVRIWFYDQIGFSGANFQGQVVQRHPEHAGRWLERVVVEGDGDLTLTCPAGGVPVAAAAVTPDGEVVRAVLDGQVARFRGAGRLMLFHVVERGFDYHSAAACRRLFAMVHGQFEQRVGHLFGSVIAGSFQDELPNMPTWSPDFDERFIAECGYDPLPQLAALWEDLGEQGARFRGDYHRVRGALAEQSFFRPLHEWHERHGLLCGVDQQIGAREGEPVASSEIYGDYVRTHRWFSAPGSDHHGDAKLHSSIAHHYDRPRVWIESFHTSGWGGTLEETFDWLLPWIGAGANLYNPHATYYSTRAGWWEWAPPATDWRQPYWRHYEPFARAVARLCSALTWGDHACEVGVLYPAATARAALRLDGAGEAGRRAEALYLDIVGRMRWFDPRPGVLNRLARDFDVLDDDSVAAASVRDGELRIGREAYTAVVLPGCAVLEARTAERLADFADAGGTLIAVGPPPADAELAARAHHVDEPDELGELLEAVPRRVQAPVPDAAADRRRRRGPVRARRVPARDRGRGHGGSQRPAPVGAGDRLPLRPGRSRALDGRRARRRVGRGGGVGAVLRTPAHRNVGAGRGRRARAARLHRRAVRAARLGDGGRCRRSGRRDPASGAARRRVGDRGRGDARGRLGRPGGARGRDGRDVGARGRRPRDVRAACAVDGTRGRGRPPGARRRGRGVGAGGMVALARHPQGPDPR